MKSKLIALAVAVSLGSLGGIANAKGCLKGAAVGGVGGHFVGNHPIIGAAAGCVVGRHMANKKSAKQQAQQQQTAPVQQPGDSTTVTPTAPATVR